MFPRLFKLRTNDSLAY